MRRKNWKKSDKFFHCLASCMASRATSPEAARYWGYVREASDQSRGGEFSEADLLANEIGITAPVDIACVDYCMKLAPKGFKY